MDLRWLVFSLVVTSAVAAADAFVPPEPVLSGLLIIGPALACARLDALRTGWVCAYALFLSVGLGFLNERVGTLDHTLRLTVLVIGTALTMFLAYSRTLRERSLTRVARVAQQAILLPFSAPVGGVEVAIRYRSANRDALVGGDLFDVANTGFGLRVLIGDARGKGLSATVTAAAALRGFRNAAYTEPVLEGLVRRLDTELTGQLAPEDFLTATIVEFTPSRVTVVNCGHYPPVLLGPRPDFLAPPDAVPPLGTGFGSRPVPRSIHIGPGESVLLYTDGLAEARDGEGRMLDVLAACQDLDKSDTPDTALDSLLDRLDVHTGGAHDDDVALVYCRTGD